MVREVLGNLGTRLNSTLDRFELLWMVLGFIYLGVYSYQVISQPSEVVMSALEWMNRTIYVIFVVELGLRLAASWSTLASAQGVLAFARKYWLSILAAFLPAVRTLRILRVVIVLRALQPFLVKRTHRLAFFALVTFPVLLFTSVVSVLDAEQDAEGANITSFGDAVWWSLASVSTVGYGDRFPVTEEGRWVATFLMVVGIGLFGALTALLAAWVMRGEEAELKTQR